MLEYMYVRIHYCAWIRTIFDPHYFDTPEIWPLEPITLEQHHYITGIINYRRTVTVIDAM